MRDPECSVIGKLMFALLREKINLFELINRVYPHKFIAIMQRDTDRGSVIIARYVDRERSNIHSSVVRAIKV